MYIELPKIEYKTHFHTDGRQYFRFCCVGLYLGYQFYLQLNV